MQTFRSACHGRPKGLHYILVAASVFFASPASAHHSAAAKYDARSALTLTGTASAFSWRNPHCHLYLDVRGGAFDGRQYVVEMSSAGVLASAGWNRSSIQPGDAIDITVLPARAGTPEGLCRACEIRINGVVTNVS